jgi:hypothetical protein
MAKRIDVNSTEDTILPEGVNILKEATFRSENEFKIPQKA